MTSKIEARLNETLQTKLKGIDDTLSHILSSIKVDSKETFSENTPSFPPTIANLKSISDDQAIQKEVAEKYKSTQTRMDIQDLFIEDNEKQYQHPP